MRIEAAVNIFSPSESLATSKLRKHATEFEGMLLTELMGKMQRTFSRTESGAEEGDAASNTISSMGTQALAQALASKNVLGIGAMVARSLAGTTTEVTSPPLLDAAPGVDIPSEEK